MTKKVHILKESLSEIYHGIGISTSEPELQVAMLINSSFPYVLRATEPIQKLVSESSIKFPHLTNSKEDSLICHLIKNIHKGITLFPSYPRIDYLFLCQGPESNQTLERVSEALKAIPSISLVVSIEFKKLKGISQFL